MAHTNRDKNETKIQKVYINLDKSSTTFSEAYLEFEGLK